MVILDGATPNLDPRFQKLCLSLCTPFLILLFVLTFSCLGRLGGESLTQRLSPTVSRPSRSYENDFSGTTGETTAPGVFGVHPWTNTSKYTYVYIVWARGNWEGALIHLNDPIKNISSSPFLRQAPKAHDHNSHPSSKNRGGLYA